MVGLYMYFIRKTSDEWFITIFYFKEKSFMDVLKEVVRVFMVTQLTIDKMDIFPE